MAPGNTSPVSDPFPYYSSSEISKAKKDLNIDQEKLRDAFDRLEKVLDSELAKLKTEIIPVFDFGDFAKNDNKFDDETITKIKKHGVVVIRNVIEKNEAENLLDDLEKYMEENGEAPKDKNKTWYDIYWSKTQIKARHHSNMMKVQNALLSLWSTCPDLDKSVNLDQPLTYNDRLRFRKPGKFLLKPHMDSGSLNRWADPSYKVVFLELHFLLSSCFCSIIYLQSF